MDSLLHSLPSPIEEIRDDGIAARGVRLLVKRDDLRYLSAYAGDRTFGGNKWRKLKYNLLAAREQGFRRLLTFGGAYSNQIAATASAGALFGVETVGIIRGEASEPLNPVLTHARRCGMQLHYLDRSTYRQQRYDPVLRQALGDRFGPSYLLPEGGSNTLALRGCAELIPELAEQLGMLPDYCCVACGTGGTLAGIISGLAGRQQALGIAALRGNFLTGEVRQLLQAAGSPNYTNWEVNNDFHGGGYAKIPPELKVFIDTFRKKHGIRLDPVYTGKLFLGLSALIEQGVFPEGSTVMAVHSGGILETHLPHPEVENWKKSS